MSLREVKHLVWSHTAGKWKSWDLSPVLSKAYFLFIMLLCFTLTWIWPSAKAYLQYETFFQDFYPLILVYHHHLLYNLLSLSYANPEASEKSSFTSEPGSLLHKDLRWSFWTAPYLCPRNQDHRSASHRDVSSLPLSLPHMLFSLNILFPWHKYDVI